MTPAVGQTRRAAAAGESRSAAAARRVEKTAQRGTRRAAVRVQRRVSGPVAPQRAPQRTTQPALRPLPVLGTIGSHALRAGKTLHDSSLLDRLVRGRGWVAVLGALLIGLVALNVSLLKLNAQAGRNAAASRELRISNAELNGKVTRLASAERLQAAGEKLGMVPASAGAITYLKSHGRGDGKLAATKLEQYALNAPVVPDPTTTDPTTTDPAATVTPDPNAVATPETTTEGAPVQEPTTTDDANAAPVPTEPAPGTG